MIRVTVWNEHIHEEEGKCDKSYPQGIEKCISEFLESDDIKTRTAIQSQPEHGLTDEVLDDTDVLIWWAHVGHRTVDTEIARRVCDRVLGGMGIIFLHSAHESKPFRMLMGTSGALLWRETGDCERIWTVDTAHPIAQGVPMCIMLDEEETYGEPFDIATPDELVFISSFSGGEVIRSGCCWKRGRGKIFYFRPGHETYKTYYNKDIQTVIKNAVYWAKPVVLGEKPKSIHYIP